MGLSTVSIFKNIDVENNPDLKVVSDEELHKLQGTLFEMLEEIEIDSCYRIAKKVFDERQKAIGYFDETIQNPQSIIKDLNNGGVHVGLKVNTEKLLTQDGKKMPFNVYSPAFVKSYFLNIIKPLNAIGIDFY